MSLLGLGALCDLNTLVQQQFSVLAGEAEDERTLLHRDPAGSLLPEGKDIKTMDDRDSQTTSLILVIMFLNYMLFNGFTSFSNLLRT